MAGSITKRGEKKYLIRVWMGRDPVTGKALRPGFMFHGTKKEAQKELARRVQAFESGAYITDEKFTLNQFIEDWLEKTLPSEVKPRTLETYTYDLERLVKEDLGRWPICKIHPSDIQDFYFRLLGNGVGPSSIKRLHAPLRKIFHQALILKKIVTNPILGIKVPKLDQVKKRPPKPMSPEQAVRFLDAAGETPYLALFEVAMSSGMRPGELLGLSWTSVDWSSNQIIVERSVQRLKKKQDILGPTKTDRIRSITLPRAVMKSLKEHRASQNRDRLRMGDSWDGKHNLVFPNEVGGIWEVSNFKSQAFKKVQRLAGLKGFNPYSLRHTCATLLLLKGVQAKIVSERLGHSTISQTLDTYSHILPSMQQAASDRLEEVLFQSV